MSSGAHDVAEASTGDDEAMQEQSETTMDQSQGTFIAGTAEPTVNGTRTAAQKTVRTAFLNEDALNRRIADYGLISPVKAKNVVWHFFRKYNPRKLPVKNVGSDKLHLDRHALCMLCYKSEDDRTRQTVTVVLGKDNSPTPLVEHMRVHHHTDYEEVLRGNKLGLSVCDFTSRLNVAVDTLLGTNASVAQTPHAPGGTPTPMTGTVNPANGAGAGAHAATMARFAATTALFQAPTEQPTPRGKQISMSDMFQPSAAWTQGEDRHWKEQLVGLIAEQYLSFAIVDSPAFRTVIGTLNPKASIPSRTSIVSIVSEMRVHMQDEIAPIMRGQWVCHTADSWTSQSGHTYLGVCLQTPCVMLPQVQEEQEESVWLVLQDRCQEMIMEDQVQRDKGPAAGVPGAVPQNTEISQSSAHSNLLGCKKVSKIVMTPVSVTGHVAVDTSKLSNEVSPIKTYTLYLS